MHRDCDEGGESKARCKWLIRFSYVMSISFGVMLQRGYYTPSLQSAKKE